MTKNEMRDAILVAWYHLERMGYDRDLRFNIQPMIWDAETAEKEAEKTHRGIGRRFTHGQASYRLPVEDTARLFVLQHAYQAAKRQVKPPKTFWEAASLAPRWVMSCAIGEAIRDAKKVRQAFPDTRFLGIDYAKDVAS